MSIVTDPTVEYLQCDELFVGIVYNSAQHVSMIQTIKYYFKTRGLSSASFNETSWENYVINPKMYRNMNLA